MTKPSTNFYQQILNRYSLVNYRHQIVRINALEFKFAMYNNFELQSKTIELKIYLLKQGKSFPLIEEAFALIRESSKRVLGLRHFDVQLLGGLVINEDKIAEMKTGEGKTLVSILPAFFNALYEQGVQIITINEYLAARDSQFTTPVHRLLGLSVGLVTESMGFLKREVSYNYDVTYVTNSELGFDYLRDNLVQTPSDIVQRSLFYCIIDEIDSILIDDASTPLVISGIPTQPDNNLKKRYRRATYLANFLDCNKHYKAEERMKSILFTDEGILVTENCLEINTNNLYMAVNPFWFLLLNAIKAKEFYKLNRNYLIDPSSYKIVILDEFTGRALQGRRWSGGLQEAIEAKENLSIDGKTLPLASISYQNLFLLYDRLSGMSGTAQTEKQEFKTIYNLAIVTIPTNKPSNRRDYPDFVYIRQIYKWKAVINDCKDMHFLQRPVLVGTKTITNSEKIADFLLQIKVPYQLLNARPKNFVRESKIIAQAGCKGIITIATNMAGRGTDIALGGNPQYFAKTEIKKTTSFLQLLTLSIKNPFTEYIDKLFSIHGELVLGSEVKNRTEKNIDFSQQNFKELTNFVLKKCTTWAKINRKKVIKSGGLHIIGTERNESRRIDNQLRGRAGRQGEPGSSKFFMSLDDDVLRQFGSEALRLFYSITGEAEDTPLQSQKLSIQLTCAQQKVEALFFDARKRFFEYDQILNLQRIWLYQERSRKLGIENDGTIQNKSKTPSFFGLVLTVKNLFNCISNSGINNGRNRKVSPISSREIMERMHTSLEIPLLFGDFGNIYGSSLVRAGRIYIKLKGLSNTLLFAKYCDSSLTQKFFTTRIITNIILQLIDEVWADHLQRMVMLKEITQWSAYGRRNPITEYKRLSFYYFLEMVNIYQQKILSIISVSFEDLDSYCFV